MTTPSIGHNNPPSKVKMTDIPVTLYQRSESPNWYMRIWFKEVRKYKIHCCETPNLNDAKAFAVQKYAELIAMTKHDIPIFSKSVEDIALGLLKKKLKQVEYGDISKGTCQSFKSKVDRFIIPFMGKRQINSITQKDIEEFWEWRIHYWVTDKDHPDKKGHPSNGKLPNNQTLHNEKNVLSAIFNEAVHQEIIKPSRVPKKLSPPVKRNVGRRGYFSKQEYAKINKFIREKWVNADKRKTVKFSRVRLQYLIRIVVHSGMRPPEFYNLRWNDVMEGKENGFRWTYLNVHGKAKKHTINCNKCVGRWLKDYRKILKDQYGWNTKGADLVFADIKSTERKGSLNKSLKQLMVKADIPTEYQGESRTLYSLRHTYATFQLMAGTPYEQLAENMDTGLDMIRDHYGHVPTAQKAFSQIYGQRKGLYKGK